jgi:hypothetical protein
LGGPYTAVGQVLHQLGLAAHRLVFEDLDDPMLPLIL